MDINSYTPWVYKINTSEGTGTGFAIKGEELVITNYHVVGRAKQVGVESVFKDRYLGRVMYVNPKVDLAFIKVDGLNTVESQITLNRDAKVNTKDRLVVLGYPFGMPFTVTEGIVSSAEQNLEGVKYIQTDAAVNPGNSGGPMISDNGDLVAITTSKFNNADNVGFGITLESLTKDLDNYKRNNISKYSLACPSCRGLVFEATEYCPSCGGELDKKIFREEELDDLQKFVEDGISRLGINPIVTRYGQFYWEFHNGSSLIRIFLFKNSYLFATSPINNIPEQNSEALYDYILSESVKPYKLGICENEIYVSYRVHLSDIFSENNDKIKEELTNLISKADELDDYLYNTYNCPFTTYSKENTNPK
ncbi:MAG: trypsin-like peptidase domain-containing protein [Bacteroidales bacterium]